MYFENDDLNQDFSKILTKILMFLNLSTKSPYFENLASTRFFIYFDQNREFLGYLDQNRDVSKKIEIFRKFDIN